MLFRNSILNLGSGVAPLIFLLLCIPAIEKKHGLEVLSLFILMSGLINIFGTLDFGLSRNVIIETYREGGPRKGNGDGPFSIGLRLSVLVSTILAAFVLLTALAVHTFFDATHHLLSASLFCLSGCISIPSLCYRSLLEIRGQFIRLNIIRSLGACVVPMSPLLVADLGGGDPLFISALLILATRIAMLVSYYAASRSNKTRCDVSCSRQEQVRFFKQSNHIGLAGIVSLILVYGDRYVIAAVLGGVVAGQYALAYDTVAMGWLVVAALMSASLPAIAADFRGEIKPTAGQSGAATQETKRMITLFMVLPGAAVVVAAPHAYDWWIGSQGGMIIGKIASILVVGLVASAMTQLNLALLQVAGGVKISGQLQLLNLALAIVLLAVLLPVLGVTGAALAFSVRLCVESLLVRWALNRQLGPDYGFRSIELVGATIALASLWAVGVALT